MKFPLAVRFGYPVRKELLPHAQGKVTGKYAIYGPF